ncbi:Calx-beta domain-containing protein [Niveispirillum sp. KHB5.9]|uniref:Calx-beta domain-containing protein n=1 Tax=Niveispirillum sp. KHB5.9 TaxID=3400269 RepID=UPI003A84C526
MPALTGTSNGDTLVGGVEGDTITGLGGNDNLDGSTGDDQIDGGEGNDFLYGGFGTDTLISSLGDDTIFGDAGNDSIQGGDGNDLVVDFSGANRIDGGAGNDEFRIYASGNTITGGSGVDTIQFHNVTSGAVSIVTDFTAGAGGDIVDMLPSGTNVFADTLGGNLFDNHLRLVQNGADTVLEADYDGGMNLFGYSFTPILRMTGVQAGSLTAYNFKGLAPLSTIVHSLTGGAGNDRLDGFGGNDTLDGGAGNDMLAGGAGNDRLTGGAGIDVALFTDIRARYTITRQNELTIVRHASGEIDILNGVEYLAFTDQTISTAVPTLSFTGGAVKEGASGTASLLYTVTLSEASFAPVTFTAHRSGGTAMAGSDYSFVNHAITIAAGATSATIEVLVSGDTKAEADETVILTLSNVSGATLVGGGNIGGTISATGKILDDDSAAAFTLAAYRALNPDLISAFGTDDAAYVRHYITNGKAEGRATSGFDAEAYAALNPDLYTAFGLNADALASHYRTNGKAEGRLAEGFDADAYAALNPDLFTAFGTNHATLISHYISNGRAEGRVATGFDVEAYAAQNGDLYRAFGLNAASLIDHYIKNGRAEGRPVDGFDAETYAALNPDLFSAFGLNHSALISHYISNGKAEGRPAFTENSTPAAAPWPCWACWMTGSDPTIHTVSR